MLKTSLQRNISFSIGHDYHSETNKTENSCDIKNKNIVIKALPVWSDSNNCRPGYNSNCLTALSFIHRPALLLSSDRYYNIISCLSSILLSGLLSVRYRGVSEKTHKHEKKLFHNVSKDNYIIPVWKAKTEVIIRQVFLPIKVLNPFFLFLSDIELYVLLSTK